ncbi:MAG: sigma-54-dependent Fis family transcriptional regulator [Candidatus Hydrogenedentes bacterium]|nr:sigma-54-dependent Fis family transcriptional regulator [Candidatus Hydrogenedentota bacterium]
MNAHWEEESIAPGLPVERSPAMEHVYRLAAQVASGNTAVLLRGERGTGAEGLARSIHAMSSRASKPFVKVSWAEVTEAFVETELFGFETSASRMLSQPGRLEEADNGTLFIEELGVFSLATQGKVMRCVRERAFARSGTSTPKPVDVRVIAASTQDLERLVAEGRFLKDFCEEPFVFTLRIPPLRERKTDILLLAQHYIRQLGQREGRPAQRLSSAATSLVLEYPWPGNQVELEQCIAHAVLLCTGEVIDVKHLPASLQQSESDAGAPGDSLPATLESVERTLIIDALRVSNGNRAKAAQLLGITERLMGLRVRKYRIDPRSYRAGSGG